MTANQHNDNKVAMANSPSPIDSNLLEALESARDRISVLRLEQDIIHYLADNARDVLEIPSLNSYQRLLAHKTGEYYQLTHVSDPARQTILFHKHPWSKIPALKLCDVQMQGSSAKPVLPSAPMQQIPSFQIMKRDATKSPANLPQRVQTPVTSEPSNDKEKIKLHKEERYKAARARIFQGIEESEMPPEKAVSSASRKQAGSRSNSRDARQRSARRRDVEDIPSYTFTTPSSQDFFYDFKRFENGPQPFVPVSESVHQRHQQYFQPAVGFNSPAEESPSHARLWTTGTSGKTAPLSMANLATLDAQTARPGSATPYLVSTQSSPVQGSRTPNRVLAPPVVSGGNLWSAPVSRSPLTTRNASALGLNLSASPWTPKSATAGVASRPCSQPQVTVDGEGEVVEEEEDPTNVLRTLALDDKK